MADMRISDSQYIEVSPEMADVEVPFPSSQEKLTDMRAIQIFDKDQLSGKFEKWPVRFVRKMGHLHAKWPVRVMSTLLELRLLHRNFKNISSVTLYDLIKRA